MSTNVIMPQLGESVVEGTVSKWLKKPGDSVQEFEPLAEINTDKVDTEIPSPASGILLKIYVAEGTTVERGVLLAVIGKAGEALPDVPSANGAAHGGHAVPAQPVVAAAVESADDSGAQRYSPVVTRMAAEHKIDLNLLKGSGLGGRITKKDVEAYIATHKVAPTPALQPKPTDLPPWEQPGSGDLFKPTEEIYKAANAANAAPASKPTVVNTPALPAPNVTGLTSANGGIPGELVPLTNMRRLIAEHMVRSKLQTAPHVTTVFEIDMHKAMAHWKANESPFAKQGLRLTLTAYFVTAIVRACQAYPILNSRWSDEGIFVYHAVNVGMAVALNDGLIVPVIKNAQDLNLHGAARHVSDLARRARDKALKPDETSGGTITLTNHGVAGSLMATPIINQPQSAIIGVGAVQKRVVVVDSDGIDAIAIRPMMYATLTFDHRITDGSGADGFMMAFKKTLENWA